MAKLIGMAREPDEVLPAPSDALYQQITHPDKRAFLSAFSYCGRIRRAALEARVNWRMHYHWLKDAVYAAAFEQAKELAADFLEDEAVRRATEGVQRAIYHKGDKIGEETIYSDTLLIFMLKAMRPERFRDNTHVKVEQDIQVNITVEERTRQANERLLKLRHGYHQSPQDRVPGSPAD